MISLVLGTQRRRSTSGRHVATRGVAPSVVAAVHARDHHVCQCCGFRSPRFQEALALGGSPRDVDAVITTCTFCWQCFRLDQAAGMQAGVLIWLPEVAQVALHHVAREVYVAMLTHAHAGRAKRVLSYVVSRRDTAHARLGTDDPAALADMLDGPDPDGALSAELRAGIRLLPLDRRIVTEQQLQYNQFPAMLRCWRFDGGPFAGRREFPWLDAVERELLPPELGGSALAAARRPTYGELAVSLLRDAAVFFENLADHQPGVAAKLRDNVDALTEVAARLETRLRGDADTDSAESARHVHDAAALLRVAADFFESTARQNPVIAEQLLENSETYRRFAAVLDSSSANSSAD